LEINIPQVDLYVNILMKRYTRLLIDKEIFTKEEFLEMVNVVDREMKKIK
jgi:hypothetical protein